MNIALAVSTLISCTLGWILYLVLQEISHLKDMSAWNNKLKHQRSELQKKLRELGFEDVDPDVLGTLLKAKKMK